MSFKPMLAATVVDRSKLVFPYLVSAKLDGIRCVILNGQVLSRSLKPIRNRFIVSMLKDLPNMDGELIVGDTTKGDVFNRTTRGVMSADGEPDFKYYVFDTLDNLAEPFYKRLATVHTTVHVIPVLHTRAASLKDLIFYEDLVLKAGYEGVMLRGPESPYKCGRATANENSLWKLKQFTDGEVKITYVREGVMNNNAALSDALGGTSRATCKENMVPNCKVGTIVGIDLKTGQELELSPGKMTHDERRRYWSHPNCIIGKIAEYKCFSYGSIDAPRFATFQRFRDIEDISF